MYSLKLFRGKAFFFCYVSILISLLLLSVVSLYDAKYNELILFPHAAEKLEQAENQLSHSRMGSFLVFPQKKKEVCVDCLFVAFGICSLDIVRALASSSKK